MIQESWAKQFCKYKNLYRNGMTRKCINISAILPLRYEAASGAPLARSGFRLYGDQRFG